MLCQYGVLYKRYCWISAGMVTIPNLHGNGLDFLHVFLATWPQAHWLGAWWPQAFLSHRVDAICIAHFSFPLLIFDLFLSLTWALTSYCFSHPPPQFPQNGFAEAGLAEARGMGAGEVFLWHLEANLPPAFLTGPVRMLFSPVEMQFQFSVLASDISWVLKGGCGLARDPNCHV